MFNLHPRGGQSIAGRSVAEARPHELYTDHSPAGPLGGELLDLYGAILIIVPLAFFLKSFLF
jgi:hypothetical protein